MRQSWRAPPTIPVIQGLFTSYQTHHPPTRHPTPTDQLFELLMTLSGSPRYQPLLAPTLPELAALCITYSQMSGEQEEGWAADPNALIADEETDFVGCRWEKRLLSCGF